MVDQTPAHGPKLPPPSGDKLPTPSIPPKPIIPAEEAKPNSPQLNSLDNKQLLDLATDIRTRLKKLDQEIVNFEGFYSIEAKRTIEEWRAEVTPLKERLGLIQNEFIIRWGTILNECLNTSPQTLGRLIAPFLPDAESQTFARSAQKDSVRSAFMLAPIQNSGPSIAALCEAVLLAKDNIPNGILFLKVHKEDWYDYRYNESETTLGNSSPRNSASRKPSRWLDTLHKMATTDYFKFPTLKSPTIFKRPEDRKK